MLTLSLDGGTTTCQGPESLSRTRRRARRGLACGLNIADSDSDSDSDSEPTDVRIYDPVAGVSTRCSCRILALK